MSIASDATNVAYIYKRRYSTRQVGDLTTRRHPFAKMLRKEDGFGGEAHYYAIRYGNPQGVGATFSTAKTVSETANQGHSFGKQLAASPKTYYGRITIDGPSLARARNNKDAFFNLVTQETDGILSEVGDSLAFQLVRDGAGARGRVNSAYSSGDTITLSVPDDARNFKIGMVIVCDDNATGASLRTGSTFVTAVDEDAGTITVDDVTDISGTLAADDYLFRSSDQTACIEGLAAHFPLSSSGLGTTWRGIDRSSDPRRLAGVRVDDTATSIEENAGLVAVKISQVGKTANTLFLNPVKFWEVSRRLNAKVTYDGGGMKASAMFEGFDIHTPAGTLRAISDPDFPTTLGYVLNMDTLYLKHLDGWPDWIRDDGGKPMLRVGDADAIEGRIRAMSNLICTEPGSNGVFSI